MSATLNRRDFLKLSGSALAGAALSSFVRLKPTNSFTNVAQTSVNKPNILLLVMDAARAQNMSVYGYARQTTPNFEKLARRGVLFYNAISTASWTLPSHASMFTSLFPSTLGTDYNSPLGSSFPTISEYLRDQGYETAGFVGNNFYCSYEYGLSRGFDHYEDYKISTWQTIVSSAGASAAIESSGIQKLFRNAPEFDIKHADEINQDFLRWLAKRKNERPFFAFLNYMDAHDPYVPPVKFAKHYSDKLPNGYLDDVENQAKDPNEIQELQDAYDGALSYLDDRIASLIDELDRLGVSDDTLIILTSDHGEHFGEHELLGHGKSLYMPLISVPLICISPKIIPAGALVPNRVSLRDIPATIVSILDKPIPEYFKGASLERFWNGDSPPSEEMIFSEILTRYGDLIPLNSSMKSILFEDVHYIWQKDAPEMLFYLPDDPGELNNLAQSSEGSSTAAYLRDHLEDFRK